MNWGLRVVRVNKIDKKEREKTMKPVYVTGLLVLLGFLAILPFFDASVLTGRALLDFTSLDKVVYRAGDDVTGNLVIALKPGELIPVKGTRVVINIDGKSHDSSLSYLIGNEIKTKEGKFYAQESSLQGEGNGYGVEGELEVCPDVEFSFIKYNKDSPPPKSIIADLGSGAADDKDAPDISAGGPKSGDGDGGGSPTPGDGGGSPTPGDGGSPPGENPGPGDGGPGLGLAVFIDSSEKFNAVINKDTEFVHYIEEGQEGAVLAKSIRVADTKEAISDSNLDLEVEDNLVRISTDYCEKREGFGEEYLESGSDDVFEIKIDLSRFGLKAKQDNRQIKAMLVYQDEILGKASKKISVRAGEPSLRSGEEAEEAVEEIERETGVAVDVVQQSAVIFEKVNWVVNVGVRKGTEKVKVNLPADVEDVEVVEVVKESKEEGAEYPLLVFVDVSKDPKQVDVDYPSQISENPSETGAGAEESTGAGAQESGEAGDSGNSVVISGKAVAEDKVKIALDKETPINRIIAFVKGIFGNDGSVTEEAGDNEFVEVSGEDKIIKEVGVGYSTEAPSAVETEFENRRKTISVFGSEKFDYNDVLIYSEIPEILNVRNPDTVHVYSTDASGIVAGDIIASTPSDTDGNGVIDYVEFSADLDKGMEKNYIIEISNAMHLNSDRDFISDIFSEVNALDGVFSEPILSGEYVRVFFKEPLKPENDISVFGRFSGNPVIEVYEEDGKEPIAVFDELVENDYNKVLLTSLSREEDVFDLKITGEPGAEAEFDYIVDPTDNPPVVNFINPTPDNNFEAGLGSSFEFKLSSSDGGQQHYAFIDFNNDLLSWIKMDEIDANGNPLDSSSYQNHGTKRGNAQRVNAGKFGKAFAFPGNGYVSFDPTSAVSNLDADDSFTVSAWVKIEDRTGTPKSIVSDLSANGLGWALEFLPDNSGGIGGGSEQDTGKITFTLAGEFFDIQCTSLGEIADNNWHFVYGKYDSDFETRFVECAIDEDASETGFKFLGTSLQNSAGLSIGSLNGDSSARAFVGGIDDVLIFNRALSESESKALYNSEAHQYKAKIENLDAGIPYMGYAVDLAGQKRATEIRTLNIVGSCIELPDNNACVEGGVDCTISSACTLNTDICTDGICNFRNLYVLGTIYTGYDSDGNGKDLNITLAGEIEFDLAGEVVFSGRKGEVGGNGGNVEIIVPRLFNRENAVFEGLGGSSHSSGVSEGGAGGNLKISYRGLKGGEDSWVVNVDGSQGVGVTRSGPAGTVEREKDLSCVRGVSERDVDVDDNGEISLGDILLIADNYNTIAGEQGFIEGADPNCDSKLNVADISRIGFVWGTR